MAGTFCAEPRDPGFHTPEYKDRSTNDFFATFGLRPKQVVDPTLRTMLTPAGGPTAADMSCADDH